MAAATPLPLNVDSEHCFPDEPGGVAVTVRMLSDAGAAGCSIEDYDPGADRILDLETAAERVAIAAEAAPLLLTARAENHLHGGDDLEDTIARLLVYRDAGADVVYAPGLRDPASIGRIVEEVGIPVNVLALPGGPVVSELASLGVRRVSTGGALARAAYGALLVGAAELRDAGTSRYSEQGAPAEAFKEAFGAGYTSAL